MHAIDASNFLEHLRKLTHEDSFVPSGAADLMAPTRLLLTLSTFTLFSFFTLWLLYCREGEVLPEQVIDLQACSILSFQLPDIISFPPSQSYRDGTKRYWALNQEEIRASCRATPRDSEDVQKLMCLISHHNITFAIQGGGHSVVANTSNIEGGIVIDLAQLKHQKANRKEGVLDVGAGSTWNEVYQYLNHQHEPGLMVAGARAGSVGVTGYLLGGGLSILQGNLGWACDSVVFFEVVLANGSIIFASKEDNPGLFKVLKGGGNNFGIITRVGLGLVHWPRHYDFALIHYEWNQLSQVVAAVTQYNLLAYTEREAQVSISLYSESIAQTLGISVILSHQDDILASPLLSQFFRIRHQLTRHERISQIDLARVYDESNPPGYRQHRTTVTFYNDARIIHQAALLFNSSFVPILRKMQDGVSRAGLLIQPLTTPHLGGSVFTGGNALGLENEDTPLLLLSLEIRSSKADYDHKISRTVSDVEQAIESAAFTANVAHAWKYSNYASAGQDPYQHVRGRTDQWSPWSDIVLAKEMYDPTNVFGRLVKDPFRIFR